MAGGSGKGVVLAPGRGGRGGRGWLGMRSFINKVGTCFLISFSPKRITEFMRRGALRLWGGLGIDIGLGRRFAVWSSADTRGRSTLVLRLHRQTQPLDHFIGAGCA